MEEKIAEWTVAGFVALFVALLVYASIMDFVDGESICEFAELNALVIAGGMGALSLV